MSFGTPAVTAKAAHALRFPGTLVQVLMLTYRYIFVLSDEVRRMRIAFRVRGYRWRANGHTYRTTAHLAGTRLVHGQERAERVSHAMRCRGFDGRFRSMTTFSTCPADVLFFGCMVAAALGLWIWDWISV